VDVDVDELRAERAAERRRQVARAQLEDDRRSGVVDGEVLDVEGARVERRVRGIGVVAGAIVVVVGVVDGATRAVAPDGLVAAVLST
jgi:hypothetical protein